MEQVRDLNIEADDMQVVLSAISGVSKRIKEVAQTHKHLAGLSGQEDYSLHTVCRENTL